MLLYKAKPGRSVVSGSVSNSRFCLVNKVMFERQPWSTVSLASDRNMPAEPPIEGGQPIQAV